MTVLCDILSWFCFIAGGAFLIIGALGILRFPDIYTRMHAASIIDTMGAFLILLGLAFQAGLTLALVKLFMIFFLFLVTSPTAAHALAKSALARGVEPLLHDGRPERSEE
ncbi:MAG: monovalent cation/H(+) antiporter subunit G [Planctomycetota bacterium]